MTPVLIEPRMSLDLICEFFFCSPDEAAFILLELAAEGRIGMDIEALTDDDIALVVDRACARMDELGV